MNRISRLVASALVVCAIACRSDSDGSIPTIPIGHDDLAQVLVEADSWTIYALNPGLPLEPSTVEQLMDRWEVRGEAVLHDPKDRARLARSLRAGIKGNDDTVAACFNPRHAIRAESERGVVDLIICFQCLQVYVYDGATGERVGSELTTKAPRLVFDEIYTAAGLEIAK